MQDRDDRSLAHVKTRARRRKPELRYTSITTNNYYVVPSVAGRFNSRLDHINEKPLHAELEAQDLQRLTVAEYNDMMRRTQSNMILEQSAQALYRH